MTLKPAHNYLLLSQDEVTEQKTDSGLYLPGKPKTLDIEGRVIAIGKDKDGFLDGLNVQIGTVVVFKHLSQMPIENNKAKFILVHMGNIVAVKE